MSEKLIIHGGESCYRYSRATRGSCQGMRVLIAYASRKGSASEIAKVIGDELALIGIQSAVHEADDVDDIEGFGAVVLGSSVFTFGWEKQAMRFARRHVDHLKDKHVWLFSSMTEDIAPEREGSQIRGASKVASMVAIKGHRMFIQGQQDSSGITGQLGAVGNMTQVRDWIQEIGPELKVVQYEHV